MADSQKKGIARSNICQNWGRISSICQEHFDNVSRTRCPDDAIRHEPSKPVGAAQLRLFAAVGLRKIGLSEKAVDSRLLLRESESGSSRLGGCVEGEGCETEVVISGGITIERIDKYFFGTQVAAS